MYIRTYMYTWFRLGGGSFAYYFTYVRILSSNRNLVYSITYICMLTTILNIYYYNTFELNLNIGDGVAVKRCRPSGDHFVSVTPPPL